MTPLLRLVQFSVEWMNPEVNLERILAFIEEAGRDDVDILVFPELSNLGYITPISSGGLMEYPGVASESEFRQLYRQLSEPSDGPFISAIAAASAKHHVQVILGTSRVDGSDMFNSAIMVTGGGDIVVQDKLHIPLNEKSFFTAGESIVMARSDDLVCGLTVCYDSRFPEVSRVQTLAGANLIVSVLAGPDQVMQILGTPETLIFRAHVRAQENGVFYATCNRSGTQGSTRFIGHSGISAPSGKILAQGGWEESTIEARLQLDEVSSHSSFLGVLADRRPGLYSSVVSESGASAESAKE